MHGPVPLQPPPDQPLKDDIEPPVLLAVSVIGVFFISVSVQPLPVASQLMPLGLEVTVPLPC